MVLNNWKRLPRSARNLIIYYSISSMYLVGDIFEPIYLFILGWSLIYLGVLYTYSYVIGILGSIIIGKLFDKGFQPKWAMLIFELSSIFFYSVYAFYPRIELVFLAHGITMFLSPLSVSYQTMEKELYPEEIYESAFAIHMALPNATQLVSIISAGFFLTYIMPNTLGFKILYIACTILSIISSLFILLGIPKIKKVKASGLKFSKISRKILPLVAAELIILFGYSISPQFIYLNYVYNIAGMNLFLISITIAFANLAGIIGSLIAERGESSFRNITIAIISISVSYSLMYTAKFVHSTIQIFILSSIFAFTSYISDTIWFIYHRTALYERVPKEIKGTVFGVMSSLRMLVFMVTPIISALIASRIDPLATFILSSIIIITSIPLYAIGLREESKN